MESNSASVSLKPARCSDMDVTMRLKAMVRSAASFAVVTGIGKAPVSSGFRLRRRVAWVRMPRGFAISRAMKAAKSVQHYRRTVLQSYSERLQSRLQELLSSSIDKERILQEAALLVDRSDIQEEIVRLETHVQHFLGLLEEDGEIGKKLDFLLQEMNREANTLLSKTSGLAGEALKITEAGLAMKAEIEKSREQVQNLE